jgi:hypothetical protein
MGKLIKRKIEKKELETNGIPPHSSGTTIDIINIYETTIVYANSH